MNRKIHITLLACVAVTVGMAAYQRMGGKPALPAANAASCQPDAIKRVVNITERAVLSARCAKSGK
jgi:entry exclusion lipoprotein TrbK